MLSPIHIATRGRLDGEYGIATRGYLILPEIVPRFPDLADVDSIDSIGDLSEMRLEVEVKPRSDWFAIVRDLGQDAFLRDLGMEASVVSDDDLDGDLEAAGLVSDVVSDDREAELDEAALVGVVGEDEREGMIDEQDVIADIEDSAPHC